MNNKILNNQKGFSLVELIIVIAMIAVLSTSGLSLLGMLNGKYARTASQTFTSALSGIKTDTLAKSKGASDTSPDVYMVLSLEDNVIYVKFYNTNGSTEPYEVRKVAEASRVDVSFTVNGTDYTNLTAGGTSSVKIAYSRATGGFLNAYDGSSAVKGVKFTQGSHVYQTDMKMLTGKFTTTVTT